MQKHGRADDDAVDSDPAATEPEEPIRRGVPSGDGHPGIKKKHMTPSEKSLSMHLENIREFQDKRMTLESERLKLSRKHDARKDEQFDIKGARLAKQATCGEARLQKGARAEEARV